MMFALLICPPCSFQNTSSSLSHILFRTPCNASRYKRKQQYSLDWKIQKPLEQVDSTKRFCQVCFHQVYDNGRLMPSKMYIIYNISISQLIMYTTSVGIICIYIILIASNIAVYDTSNIYIYPYHISKFIYLRSTPHPVTVTNEGLGWDSLLKMVHNPGGDCYWVGGRSNIYHTYTSPKKKGTYSVLATESH